MENNEIKYGQMNFDLPHDVVPLPSQGIFYKNKKKSVKVGYLTAQDENLLSSRNIDGGQLITQLLRNKIYEPELKVEEMLTGDVEAILIFLRNTAFGTTYIANVLDPKTGQFFSAEVDLSELNIKSFKIDVDGDGHISTTLPTSGDVVKLRFLTYGQDMQIDKELEKYPKGLVAPTITRKLEEKIVSINGNTDRGVVAQYVQQMPIKDSKFVRNFLFNAEPRLDLKKKVITPSGEEIDVTIDFGVDFFRPFFGV